MPECISFSPKQKRIHFKVDSSSDLNQGVFDLWSFYNDHKCKDFSEVRLTFIGVDVRDLANFDLYSMSALKLFFCDVSLECLSQDFQDCFEPKTEEGVEYFSPRSSN